MAGVRRYEDLDCWKLAMELADLYDAMTCTGPASRDLDLKKQLQTSGTKAPAQIAEGFMRFTPADFANFLRMARASLGEKQTHLERGRRRKYWSEEEVQRARALGDRAIGATTNLMKNRLAAAEAAKRKPSSTYRDAAEQSPPRRTKRT